MGSWTFVSLVGLGFLVWFVLVFLFTPRIDYHLTGPLVDEAQLLRMLQEECQARLHTGNCAAVLPNGTQFYPAMLAAIREVLVETLARDPGNTDARAILAITLAQSGDAAAGVAQAERAIADAPDDGRIRYNVACA